MSCSKYSNDNLILKSDSYKYSHAVQYPAGTTEIYSYFAPRGGKYSEVCFVGLQIFIQKYLVGKVITKEHYLGKTIPKDVEEMKKAWFRELQGEVYKKFEDIKKHFQKEWKRIPSSVKKKQLEEMDDLEAEVNDAFSGAGQGQKQKRFSKSKQATGIAAQRPATQ